MKKVELFTLLIVIIILSFFVVLYFTSKSKSEIQVFVYPLENKLFHTKHNDSILANRLTGHLLENYKPSRIEINFLLPNIQPLRSVELKSSIFKDKQQWKIEIFKKIFNGLRSLPEISFSNDSINEVLTNYLKHIELNSKSPKVVNVIVGKFPDCYNDISREKLLNQLDKMFKNRENSIQNIVTYILNPRENLEKKIFNAFNEIFPNKFKFQEIQTELQHDCLENYPKIYAMFLKKFDFNEKIEFLNFLRNTFGEKFHLHIIQNGPLNGHIFTYTNKPADSVNLFKTLDELKDETFESTSFVFKELYNITSKLPDTLKNALIVGSLKYSTQRKKGFEDGFWEKFSKVKGLRIYPVLPTYTERNWRDKDVFDALIKEYQINIVKN